MSLTATYDSALSRVQLSATDAYSAAYIVIQRSSDGVTWTTVRGATGLAPGAASIDDYEFAPNVLNTYRARSYSAVDALLGTDTQTVTPTITAPWIKSVSRPFLNMAVTVQDYGAIGRRSRAGIFEIPGRSFPVRVGDVASSRSWQLEVLTSTLTEARNLEFLAASGDVAYVQIPPGYDIPGGYVDLGDMTRGRVSRPLSDDRRLFTLPMREVAPPAASVVGYTAGWDAIIADFGSWTAVLAAFATWADLLEYVADPSVVIVP